MAGRFTISNILYTFKYFFEGSATADRTITLPDKSGTVAMTNDTRAKATVSSAVTQTVISTSVAYPVLFETNDELSEIERAMGTVSINSASPCTLTCVAPATTLLSSGTPIKFTILSDITKGIALDTIYYVTNISVGLDTFQLSSTIALARAGTANINTTGAITGTYECVSRLYFLTAGTYLIIISALLDTTNTSGDNKMDLWFVKGNKTDNKVGTNLGNSNTQAQVDATGIQQTVAVALTYTFAVGEYLRLDYHGDTTTLRWVAVAAAGSPDRPACPSVIVTINKVGPN